MISTEYMCKEKNEEEESPTLKTFYKTADKREKKTDCNDQKHLKQHKNQQNNNNLKTKMGRKINLWLFQAANKQNFTREDVEMAKNGNPREKNWISSKSNTK